VQSCVTQRMSKFISPLWKTELGLHHHFEMFDVSRLSHGKVCYCGIIYPEKVLLLDNAIISTKQYCKITCRPDTLEQKYCSNSNASIPYRKYHLVIICPIAIAYSMGQMIKSFCVCACVCVCVCVRLWTLSRSHFFVDFHQIGHTDV